MCDGYFFPVSFNSNRKDFRRDANVCSQRCPGQGKLFYAPSPHGDLDNARSQDGQLYRKLNTAFLYRKERVKSCNCRPEPWEHSERLRHAMYSAKTGAVGGPQVIAGNYAKPKKRKDGENEDQPAETDGVTIDPAGAEGTALDVTPEPTEAADAAPVVANSDADGATVLADAPLTGVTDPASASPIVPLAKAKPVRRANRVSAQTRASESRQAVSTGRTPPRRKIERTRRAGIFPFLSGTRTRQMRFPGD